MWKNENMLEGLPTHLTRQNRGFPGASSPWSPPQHSRVHGFWGSSRHPLQLGEKRLQAQTGGDGDHMEKELVLRGLGATKSRAVAAVIAST